MILLKKSITCFVLLVLVGTYSTDLIAQNRRDINRNIRKSMRALKADMQILRKYDQADYKKYVMNNSIPNSKLDFLYENIKANMSSLKKNLKFSSRNFGTKKRRVVRRLTKLNKRKVFGYKS